MHRRTLVFTFVASCVASVSLQAQIEAPEYAARRAALGQLAGDAAILVLGAGEPLHDVETFAPSAQLRYLTGWKQPYGALLIVREGGKQREVLFVAERSPAQEVWTGMRPSLAAASTLTGLATRNIGEMTAAIDSVLATKLPIRIVGEFGGQTGPAGEAVPSERALMASLRARRPDVPVTPAVTAIQGFAFLRGGMMAAAPRSAPLTVCKQTVAGQWMASWHLRVS